jgi:peptidoglycan/xylan/chitin deacetylase (PgdA/CDA1 family)
MSSRFIISLDFELMWGVRDKRSIESYGKQILGGREAIPKILELFRQHQISATWATVGLLFAKNRDEMLAYAPKTLPDYKDRSLSPYASIENFIGNNEKEDPYHYGHDLILKILEEPRQEIATHTFSHYYSTEDGPSLAAFEADIHAAKSIAKISNCDLKSIVFPRNQISQDHIKICAQLGITSYRGNAESFSYRSRSNKEQTLFVRGLRLTDSILPLEGLHGYSLEEQKTGIVNIPASRMLRSVNTGAKRHISHLQTRRIRHEMTAAAKANQMYHLWWHPHNFGINQTENLQNLKTILEHFSSLKSTYGMQSLNMAEVGSQQLGFNSK